MPGNRSAPPLQDEGQQAKTSLSDYELLRLANIARNEAILRELGLVDDSHKPPGRRQDKPSGIRSRRRKRADGKGNVGQAEEVPRPPPRRSRRLQGVDQDDPMPAKTQVPGRPSDSLAIVNGGARDSARNNRRPSSSGDIPVVAARMPAAAAASSAGIAPDSTRAIRLDVPALLDRMLGRTLDAPGKAPVVREAYRIAGTGHRHPDDGFCPRFNKYSGLLEWSNASAFLWVNLGGQNDGAASSYPNQFREEGRFINWYASNNAQPDSPAMQRLVDTGSRQTSGNTNGSGGKIRTEPGGLSRSPTKNGDGSDKNGDEQGGVVLWCRRYDPDRRSYEPYVCLGRLRLVSHDVASRPIEFLWELEDRDRLYKQEDKPPRDAFGSLVRDFSR